MNTAEAEQVALESNNPNSSLLHLRYSASKRNTRLISALSWFMRTTSKLDGWLCKQWLAHPFGLSVSRNSPSNKSCADHFSPHCLQLSKTLFHNKGQWLLFFSSFPLPSAAGYWLEFLLSDLSSGASPPPRKWGVRMECNSLLILCLLYKLLNVLPVSLQSLAMEDYDFIFPEDIKSAEWGEWPGVTELYGGSADLPSDMLGSKSSYTLEPFGCSCYLIRSLVFLP